MRANIYLTFSLLERPGIRCKDDVALRQCAIMRALRNRLSRNDCQMLSHTDNRYSSLIVQLNDLENINKIHEQSIEWLRSNWSSIRLPTLFAEIFDIPIGSRSSISGDSSSGGSSSLTHEQDTIGEEEEDDLNQDEDEHLGDHGHERIGQTHTLKQKTDKTSQQHSQGSMDGNKEVDDFFFDLTSFRDSGEKIDAADLIPTVDCMIESHSQTNTLKEV